MSVAFLWCLGDSCSEHTEVPFIRSVVVLVAVECGAVVLCRSSNLLLDSERRNLYTRKEETESPKLIRLSLCVTTVEVTCASNRCTMKDLKMANGCYDLQRIVTLYNFKGGI